MERRKQDDVETSSDPQIDIKFVAVESLQGQVVVNQEDVMVEIAKSLTRDLGTFVQHIVKNKVVEDAQKALKFTKVIQSSVAEEVSEMLKSTMQVKREQESS